MLLRCLKAELVKFHRSPVWLAFVLLPVFPAILGTVNYLGNIEVLSARPLECILRVAVEAGTHGSQLEQFPHCARAYDRSMPGQIDLGRISIPSGSSVDWGPICPQWKTGRYLRAVAS